jgi:hypothetical protein
MQIPFMRKKLNKSINMTLLNLASVSVSIFEILTAFWCSSLKIEELVESLQTYEYSLPPVKRAKIIALKASKKKAGVLSEEDSDNEEDVVVMLAKNFGRLMKNDKFKKFIERLKKTLREFEPKEDEKKDPRGPRCFECSGFGLIQVDCGNLKQGKGKA